MIERTDEFRCFDPRLVQVLPGRENEAVAFAVQLRREGLCDGLFVLGEEVVDWSFLRDSAEFDRLEFIRVHSSFARIDFTLLSNAKVLRIGGLGCDIDFSSFVRLEKLEIEWTSECSGLQNVGTLMDLTISSVGTAPNARSLQVPESLRKLAVIGCQHEEFIVGDGDHELDALQVLYAGRLVRLPSLRSVKYVDLKRVGRLVFDYDSLLPTVAGLNIDSCAPIESWSFLASMRDLEYLHVLRTKCVPLPSSLASRLGDLTSVAMPRASGFKGKAKG